MGRSEPDPPEDLAAAPDVAAAGGGSTAPSDTAPPSAAAPASAAPPAPAARGLDEPGTVLLVDSLVGDINGRPIFAQKFFEPIEDRLIAASRRLSQAEFDREAMAIIGAHLGQYARNELILAEAESTLTVEQRHGLLAWLRQSEISKGGGTIEGAERRLSEQLGVGLEERVGDLRDQQLLLYLFRERIESRVVVSWHDVEREYSRRQAEFNPPSTVTLGRIRVSDPQEAARIQSDFAAGRSFAEVAISLGLPDGGRWGEPMKLGPGGMADIELADDLKPYVMNLEVGQASQPIPRGTATWWLAIIERTEPNPLGIYDPEIQQRIVLEIERRRWREEENRVIQSLTSKDIDQRLEAMARKLHLIAVLRYGGQGGG
jgi:hypothetical protein